MLQGLELWPFDCWFFTKITLSTLQHNTAHSPNSLTERACIYFSPDLVRMLLGIIALLNSSLGSYGPYMQLYNQISKFVFLHYLLHIIYIYNYIDMWLALFSNPLFMILNPVSLAILYHKVFLPGGKGADLLNNKKMLLRNLWLNYLGQSVAKMNIKLHFLLEIINQPAEYKGLL